MAKSSGSKNRIGIALLGAGIIIHVALAVYFNFTQDDAYITFRYAANFLNGNGLVYNIGERIEGYTNFLWLMFMILGRLAGLQFVIFSKVLGVICGIGTIVFTYLVGLKLFNSHKSQNLAAGIGSCILGTVLSFAYWSVAGLETATFSMMTIGAIYFYLRRSYLLVVFLTLATLLRPEGGLAAGIIVLYDIVNTRKLNRYAVSICMSYAILLIPYAFFKYSYFHALLPNSFYAKTGFELNQLYDGLEYSGMTFWHYFGGGLFLLPFLIIYRKWSKAARMITGFLLIYIIYVILIGGDVLKVHRFYVPLFPGLILLTVYGLRTALKNNILFIGSLALLIGWQIYFPLNHVKTYHSAEIALNYKMDKMIEEMKTVDENNFTLATSTIGIVGFKLLGHQVIDLLGLTDSVVARHPEMYNRAIKTTWKEEKYNSRYILSRQPDYILFSTGFKPSAPAERALFLYSKFLDSYRTVGFYFAEHLQVVYKRYFPIKGNIIQDVKPQFVQYFYDGINLWNNSKFEESISNLRRSIDLSPEPKYPYLYYYISDAYRQMGDLQTAYNLLNALVQQDTLVFEAYKDLYLYEAGIIRNKERANYFRQKVKQLAPWYIPRMEALAELLRSEYPVESSIIEKKD